MEIEKPGEDLYTKHKPVIYKEVDANGECLSVYQKTETDDNDWYFKKTGSISINAGLLESVDAVRIIFPHRDVIIYQTKDYIKRHARVYTFNRETKFYLRIENWQIESGDLDWASKAHGDLSED